MKDRTLTVRLSGRWLSISLIILLIAALVPVTALAAGQFTDDDGNTHEANIEWLASAGITVGCNPPANDNYCPDDPVTRAQMATFMRRFAQFLGAEDGTVNMADYAVNSDMLDGKDVAQVRSSVAWWSNDALPNTDVNEFLTVTVPPGGGTIVMVGSFDYWNFSATANQATCRFWLDTSSLPDTSRIGSSAPPFEWGQCSTNGARDVPAGSHNIHFTSSGLGGTLMPIAGTAHAIVIPHA
jgi:hypothetical protein